MIELVEKSLAVARTSLAEEPAQPFTQELLDLHSHVLEDPGTHSVIYSATATYGRKAVHRTLSGVLLEAAVFFPIKGTVSDHTTFRLGVREQKGPMYLEFPLGAVGELDVQNDPFSLMIADYFRAHVHADNQIVIAS